MIIEENTLQASASYEAHSLIWRSSIRKSLIRQQKLNHGGYGGWYWWCGQGMEAKLSKGRGLVKGIRK